MHKAEASRNKISQSSTLQCNQRLKVINQQFVQRWKLLGYFLYSRGAVLNKQGMIESQHARSDLLKLKYFNITKQPI